MGSIFTKICFHFGRKDATTTLKTSKDTYCFGYPLGTGSHAKVYSARSGKFHRKYAIKEIAKKSWCGMYVSNRASFLEEVLVLEKLSHRNIIKIHDIGENDDNMYIVTELCERGDLSFTHKTGRTLPEVAAVKVMIQVFSALSHMHGLGIYHGDVKPANLLIHESFSIRLADMGFSAKFSPGVAKANRRKSGTPAFLAPEVQRGDRYFPVALDMWACGVTFFVLLTGRLPSLDSISRMDTVNSQIKVNMAVLYNPSMRSFSTSVLTLIQDLLQIDPTKRIGAESALSRGSSILAMQKEDR